ncbi:hypothetical protein TNCV_1294081, partial [Trichonephila clavipes]
MRLHAIGPPSTGHTSSPPNPSLQRNSPDNPDRGRICLDSSSLRNISVISEISQDYFILFENFHI